MRRYSKIYLLCFTLFLGFFAFSAAATTYYVDINSHNPTPPYTSWGTASTDIQSAVNQAASGDVVLVNPGVYQTGGEVVGDGTLTNRVVITLPVTVQSVSGPATTVIEGYQDSDTVNGDDAVRCVYLSGGAVLSGFTITNGATQMDPDESWDYTLYSGGGIFCDTTDAVVTNCIITGCSAGDIGGGAEGCNTFTGTGGGTFLGCAFVGNQCVASAGADQCILSNCTLTANSSGYGGGAGESTLYNCILANNSALAGGQGGGGGASASILVGCTLETNSSDIGGGVWGNSENPCTLTNCTLIGNTSGNYAGGAEGATFYHCTLSGNSTVNNGGGADGSTLYGCLITNNVVLQWNGGGVSASTLYHCTLADNLAGQAGGGAYNSTLTKCLLVSNTVADWGGGGGGAYGSELDRCTLIGNIAINYGGATGGGACNCTANNSLFVGNYSDMSGGGAMYGTLNNCTLVGNSAAMSGGGAGDGYVNNCVLYYNTAPSDDNYVLDGEAYGVLDYCCIPDMPDGADGGGNITNSPCFVNWTNSDFHLQSNSPCINAGINNYVRSTNDLDGNPRIIGGTVDIGAYEYQTPVSMISYQWLEQYGLPITTNIDTSDLDGTGFDVYQDWIASLNPTNSASVLAMLPPTPDSNSGGITVTWQSVSGVLYNVERATDLSQPSPFTIIQYNVTGQAGTTSYTDGNVTEDGSYFYRVSVAPPGSVSSD